MKISNPAMLVVAVVTVLWLGESIAHAQATRTWVSGVGDDANPCSRTSPCKTLAGAISKTAAGGEIDVLDPGGFGAVTITKAISIENIANIAGVLVSGTNGIVIQAGANDAVVLRGLTIEGLGTGLAGVRFLSGKSLHVENCTINAFTGAGIDFEPSGVSRLFVTDTILRNNGGGGILVKPGAGSAVGVIDGVRAEQNSFGVQGQDKSSITVRNSFVSGNNLGLSAVSSASAIKLTLENSVTAANGVGVAASGSLAKVTISDVTITQNATGLQVSSGGSIISLGNNTIQANGTNGSPNSIVPLQ